MSYGCRRCPAAIWAISPAVSSEAPFFPFLVVDSEKRRIRRQQRQQSLKTGLPRTLVSTALHQFHHKRVVSLSRVESPAHCQFTGAGALDRSILHCS